MMELGNMAFGCSRGEFPIERSGEFETPLFYLIQETCGEETGYPEFENDTFVLRPYYWGDCTCGFDDRVWDWEESNDHKEHCYQAKVKQELKEKGYQEESFGYINAPLEEKDRARKKWCVEMGLEYPRGCAVHCTCDYKDRWVQMLENDGHSEDCLVILDNFHHKPTGFGIQWYKYPLRDSYMNMDIDAEQFREIIKDCLKSLE